MRNVVFAAPFPLEATLRFARAVAHLADVRLLGVMQQEPQGDDVRLFAEVITVSDGLSAAQLIRACEMLRERHGPIARILGILEALQVQLASARAHFSIPGTDERTADLFRDKARMKDALSAAGLPVARHRLLGSPEDGQRFAAEVGFPLVLKPPAGMGAKATFRVESQEALARAVLGMGAAPYNPVLAEEFLRGEEHSFETITTGGQVRFHSISRYLPGPLEVLENPWIQWVCLLPRDISGSEFDPARAIGFAAIEALRLSAGFTHMEWFRRSDGSLAIGEIAQRPPGAQISRMTGLAHDFDPYRAWARAVVDDAFDGPYARSYAVACAYLRGMGRGRVVGVGGVEETQRRVGHLVVEARLPKAGAPKSDSYEGDGYIIVRDPDTEVVRAAAQTIIETVRVHYAE